MFSKLVRLSALILLAVTIVVHTQALLQDRRLVKALFTDVSNADNYSKILNGLPYYQHIEKAGVRLYNEQIKNNQLNCNQIKLWGDKLTTINKRNTQGYYLLTACAESEGNEEKAIDLIEIAIKYDPLNSQYLLGAAILYLNSDNLNVAESYLNKVEMIDPKTFNLDKIVALLDEKKLQAALKNSE